MTLLTMLILATSEVRTDGWELAKGGFMPVIENMHMCGEWRLLISWDKMTLSTREEAKEYAQRLIDWAKVEYEKGPNRAGTPDRQVEEAGL